MSRLLGSSALPSLPWPSDIYPGHFLSRIFPPSCPAVFRNGPLPGFTALFCHLSAGVGRQVTGWRGAGKSRDTSSIGTAPTLERDLLLPHCTHRGSHVLSLSKGPQGSPCRATSTAPASLFSTLAPWPHAVGACPCSVPLPTSPGLLSAACRDSRM